MIKRLRLWREIQEKGNSKISAHAMLSDPLYLNFRKQHPFNIISCTDVERQAFQKLFNNCGCPSCSQFYMFIAYESNLWWIKRKKQRTTQQSKINEVITAKCTECGFQAKSNRAAICNSKKCIQSKKAKYRNKLKQRKPQLRLTQYCQICNIRPVKRKGGKICTEKACYNTNHKNNVLKRKQQQDANA